MMIRTILSIVALTVIALGLWLIASAFLDPTPGTVASGQAVTAPDKSASPVILGVALLAGGVMFLVLIFRRR